MRPHILALPLVAGVLALGVACDYDGFDLYPQVTDVPGIIDLGRITPADVTDQASIDAAVIYGEVGATGTSERGGITLTFQGTGGSVCLFIDPELAFWNQSVSQLQPNQTYAYPDNVQDDGDLDLYAGFSVYYSGSPGEEVGDFQILYQDQLGNRVPIDLNECTIIGQTGDAGAHGGRGSPEFCTLSATQPGVDYTVLLASWATPMDDDRTAYGLLVANDTCRNIISNVSDFGESPECIIRGEGLDPETGEPIEGSEEFELAFCAATGGGADQANALYDYCQQEAETKDCTIDHCFCGDPLNSPGASITGN
jgi:hypothetical protein